MVDPVSVSVGAVVGKVAAKAIDSLSSLADTDDLLIDPTDVLHALVGDYGQTMGIVSQKQLDDIKLFLERQDIANLLHAWCILRVADSDSARAIVEESIPDMFSRAAEKHNINRRGDSWASLAPDVWKLASRKLVLATDRIRTLVGNNAAVAGALERLTGGTRMLYLGTADVSVLSHLSDVLTDPKRIYDALDDASRVCAAVSAHHAELTLSHAHEEYRVHDKELYVERSLIASQANLGDGVTAESPPVPSASLTDASKIVRAVVIGDPGVGKSTLVRHLMYTLGTEGPTVIAPVLITAREYVTNGWGSGITAYAATALHAEYDLDVSAERVSDMLTLGNVCLVFDGVDEVIDIGIRRKLIQRIESVGRKYPAATIVCTSRKVGYRQAGFGQEFHLYELSEFNTEQIDEYVRKWFVYSRQSVSDHESFLVEVETLDDIACNPLMLSLLCTLYRAKGFIPRNRRHIYRDCAELLFQRWDSMRHIEQPYEHRNYGERLMQELARFFFRSQTAQAGIEEGQLVRLVAIFFQDTGSVDEVESKRRAQQFIDFCAGRAWLLTKKGTNDRGIRLFGFTHRTFMEYFAAEAVVRGAPDVPGIAREILLAFERDQSSVMPDVMAQAADDKFERGAELVLKELLREGRRKAAAYGDKFLHLCLRIVNASPMSRAVTDFLPSEVLMYWKRLQSLSRTRESSVALFSLYRDPRAKIVKSLDLDSRGIAGELDIDDVLCLRYELCRRWVRVSQSGGYHGSVDHSWNDDLLPYFEDIRERGGVYLAALNSRRIAVFQSDPLLLNWMICRDLVAPGERVMNWIATPKFCIESEFGGRVAGAAMDAIDEIMVDDRGRSDVMRSVRRWMNEHLVKFDEFDWNRAERVAQLIGEHVELFYKYTEHENVGLLLRENPADAELVIWIGMLLWEHADGPHEFHEYVNERLAWEGGFEELGAARVRRRSKKRKKNTFDPTTMGVSEEFAEYFESWLQGASVINA